MVFRCRDLELDDRSGNHKHDQDAHRRDVGRFNGDVEKLEEPLERCRDVEGSNDGRSDDEHGSLELDGEHSENDKEDDEQRDEDRLGPIV